MAKKETYEEFVEKFKPKKTTDDCYTPPTVYDVVLNYVKEKCNIEGLKVMRPFYPGGDYENEHYPEDCVVIDNPPFSIISKIIRFYNERGIKYFLFAPYLTLFGTDQDYTSIVVCADIVYENGAKVKTSFASNMFGDVRVLGDAELHKKLKEVQEQNKVCLPRYVYPDNIVTVSKIGALVEKGVSVKIHKKEVAFCRGLESQKLVKKSIFGSGFLASDKVAKELRVKESEARELKAIQSKTEALKKEKESIIWELSDKERNIIKSLG